MSRLDNLKPFKKGQSGNPNGRPKVDPHIKEIARAASVEAMERAVKLMASADENVALKAINTVLDRGWGKPQQETALTGPGGGALQIVNEIRRVIVDPKA